MKDNQTINSHNIHLKENNFRVNELLSEQTAIIQELAPKLDTNDLKKLRANLGELEIAHKKLKVLMMYLPN